MKSLRLAGILGLLMLAGCSTIADTVSPSNSEPYIGRGPNVMGGLRMDIAHLGDPGRQAYSTPVYIIDLPFSFALDVALLPFTLVYSLFRSDNQ